MSRIVILCCTIASLLIMHEANACDKHKHHRGGQKVWNVKSNKGLSGEVCFEYKYTSEANKKQTLGRDHRHYDHHHDTFDSAGVQDVKPMTNELRRPAKTIKKKRPARKKLVEKKPEEKQHVASAFDLADKSEVRVEKKAEESKLSKSVITSPVTTEVRETDAGMTVVVNKPEQPPVKQPEIEKIIKEEAPKEVKEAPKVVEVEKVEQPIVEKKDQPVQETPAHPSDASKAAVETLDFQESEIEISSDNITKLSAIAEDLKNDPHKTVKVYSYAYSPDGNFREARRVSLQRAIKIRKYLIDSDIQPNRITVKAIDDSNSRLNRVDIELGTSF